VILTDLAPRISVSLILPVMGSISVGDPPDCATRFRAWFHCSPVFVTRELADSSMREEFAIGLLSSDVITTAPKVFDTSRERFFSVTGRAVRKPTMA
jgi:hypothetical protein